jgi:2-octaprenyl-6-methoxyphenol hydroxylase
MTKASSDNYDVAIVGGGMVGMSLAIALAREHMRVAVIEKTAMPAQLAPGFDGRVSAIALGSQRILDNIGAWEHMAAHAEPILDIRVSDGDTPFFLHYDHHEVGEEPFGYIVENRYIRHALQTAAAKLPTLMVMEQCEVKSFESSGAFSTITLSRNDEKIRARLLVAADGRHSPLRKIANIGAVQWNYSQTAIVCTIAHEKPHGGLAQERFLPAGPFAVLPMQGNRSSLVWVEPNERVQLYLELPDAEFVQEIRERVGDYLGDITVSGQRFSYPLSLMHAKTYVGERLALIGDAAHAIHPIAGQGVNLGFRDVAAMHELLTERFTLGLDIADAGTLAHFERWRRFDNVVMLATTDLLNRLFSNRIIPIQLARGLGLWAVEKMPGVKRYFMRNAMGLTGDMPKLTKVNK